MPLSDTAARQAKFTGKQQKLSDEKGLFLLITSSGKYWRLKFRCGGKEKVPSARCLSRGFLERSKG
ncbi:Arm DNA-binding domain-containing protein [Aeromonas jandaei]|uniref:Arm DNA-binding domain-containing protein n=1 Tax=Aeromonas jandaei TaxID=650 RepID=UPI0030CFE331